MGSRIVKHPSRYHADDSWTVSKCLRCRHWQKGGRCIAFPRGIPRAILNNDYDHSENWLNPDGTVGDRYILFEPVEGLTAEEVEALS